jgi:hypothetical protein
MKKPLVVLLLGGCLAIPVSANVIADHWIEGVAGDGAVIILEDRTVWGIAATDRVNTSIWLPVDKITIQKSSAQPDYPYILTDVNEKNEKAHAKYMGIP